MQKLFENVARNIESSRAYARSENEIGTLSGFVKDCKIQARHIVQILEGFVRSATPMNIISSFRSVGMNRVLQKTDGVNQDVICHPLWVITPEKCRCLLGNDASIEELIDGATDDKHGEDFVPGCGEEEDMMSVAGFIAWMRQGGDSES